MIFFGGIDGFFDKIKMSKSYSTLNRLSFAYEIRQFHIIICTLKIQTINTDE